MTRFLDTGRALGIEHDRYQTRSVAARRADQVSGGGCAIVLELAEIRP